MEEVGSVGMDANMFDTGCLRDAISFLPQEVLGKILSLLPTKLAVSTSVLSKKWRNIFALVHNLDFDDSEFLQREEGKEERDEIRESFREFVDRTLALQCGSPIKKFSLRFLVFEDSDMDQAGRWICNALVRGVSELNITLKKTRCEIYLPCELFTSKTLVKLKLGTEINLGKFPPHVSLPALKRLSIDSVYFCRHDLSSVLLPGCPVLEELYIRHREFRGHPNCISSRTIKKLSVRYDCEYDFGQWFGMSFDTPSLVSLDYSDYVRMIYKPLNLESLVEARLDIHDVKNKMPNILNFFTGISNVKTLHLSPGSVELLCRCAQHILTLPVFNNLVTLSFWINNKQGWKVLLYLLKQSPNLETLITQGLDRYTGDLDGYTGDVTMRPYQVKGCHIHGYKGTDEELEHLRRFFLGDQS